MDNKKLTVGMSVLAVFVVAATGILQMTNTPNAAPPFIKSCDIGMPGCMYVHECPPACLRYNHCSMMSWAPDDCSMGKGHCTCKGGTAY